MVFNRLFVAALWLKFIEGFRLAEPFFERQLKNKIEIRLRFHILPEDTFEPETSLHEAKA
jgi:hypothetical protein